MSLLNDIEAYAALASGNQQEYFKGLMNVVAERIRETYKK